MENFGYVKNSLSVNPPTYVKGFRGAANLLDTKLKLTLRDRESWEVTK